MALGALTLDLLTTVGDAGHTITVDGTGTLTLQGGSSITGGSLANSGTVGIEGTGATFDGVTVTGAGAVNVDAGVPPRPTTLVLKDVTSITKGTLTVGATRDPLGRRQRHAGSCRRHQPELHRGHRGPCPDAR